MIDGMSVDSLLHCVSPLFVRDRHIFKGTSKHLTQSLDNLLHRESFAHQRIHLSRWQAVLQRLAVRGRRTSDQMMQFSDAAADAERERHREPKKQQQRTTQDRGYACLPTD
jgi:hypothetical protein